MQSIHSGLFAEWKIQTNIENKVEVTKVEFQPVSDKFFGNFVIEVADRVKP